MDYQKKQIMAHKKVSITSVFKTIVWPRRKLLSVGLILIIISRLASLVLPGASKYLMDDVIVNKEYIANEANPEPIENTQNENTSENATSMYQPNIGGKKKDKNKSKRKTKNKSKRAVKQNKRKTKRR